MLLYLLIGLAIGIVIGWLLRSLRQPAAPADTRVEQELRQQVARAGSELDQARSQLAESGNARAAAEARQAAAEKILAEQRTLHERALAEAKELQAKALADLREAFKALSSDALRQTQPEFLRLANETFAKAQESSKGDLAQRQEAIKGLVEPLRQQLESYQQRLQQSEKAQSTTLGEVKQQLEQLSQQSASLANETQRFRMVLKSNPARGRWGEETLRRVVEAAGLSALCDFSEQTQAGDSKPDLIVRLPGDRFIIIDAKVPDLDFLAALDSADPAQRAESLAAHAAKLRGTIKALADRDYPRQFPGALDYVVLFLPAESLFSAALEGDRDLIIWAAERRILMATPASLIALLRSVAISWQQHKQTENAQKIAEAAQELYTRVCVFTEHFDKIRDGLSKATDAFNKAASSYQSRIRPAGEKLAELGGTPEGKSLADIQPLDATLRLPPA
jgi:DNA recombination protein RmuC